MYGNMMRGSRTLTNFIFFSYYTALQMSSLGDRDAELFGSKTVLKMKLAKEK